MVVVSMRVFFNWTVLVFPQPLNGQPKSGGIWPGQPKAAFVQSWTERAGGVSTPASPSAHILTEWKPAATRSTVPYSRGAVCFQMATQKRMHITNGKKMGERVTMSNCFRVTMSEDSTSNFSFALVVRVRFLQLVSTYAAATQMIAPNNKCEGVVFTALLKTVCGSMSTNSGKYLS